MNFLPPVTDRKIRFGLVGCGRIAQNHIAAIEKHQDRCEIVDVCDVDPVVLAAAVDKTGARGHLRLTEMLEVRRERGAVHREAQLQVAFTPPRR